MALTPDQFKRRSDLREKKIKLDRKIISQRKNYQALEIFIQELIKEVMEVDRQLAALKDHKRKLK